MGESVFQWLVDSDLGHRTSVWHVIVDGIHCWFLAFALTPCAAVPAGFTSAMMLYAGTLERGMLFGLGAWAMKLPRAAYVGDGTLPFLLFVSLLNLRGQWIFSLNQPQADFLVLVS